MGQDPSVEGPHEVPPDTWVSTNAGLDRISGEISIRRLQVLWGIAHAGSMTRAAKLLGLAQPTLSQQLSAFETAIGTRLFERRSNTLELTEVGVQVLLKAEQVLRNVQELEDDLAATGGVARHTIRIAGAGSVMRTLLPLALRKMHTGDGRIDFDLHEAAPNEVLDLLYARRVNIGLAAASAVAEAASGFRQVPVARDPYVLAVPESLDLAGVDDPEKLAADQREVLYRTLQFVFGTQHSKRIQDWYDCVLPQNHTFARVRSFETMIGLTRAGLGVCIAPALSLAEDSMGTRGLRLYETGLGWRRIDAIFPAHYHSVPACAALIKALETTGADVSMPRIEPMPPFVARKMRKPASDL